MKIGTFTEMAEENKENSYNPFMFNLENGQRRSNRRKNKRRTDEACTRVKKQKVRMPRLRVRTSDSKIRVIDLETMKCSRVVRDLVENLGVDDLEESEIPIQVTSKTLKVIIEWATVHKHDYIEIENDGDPANITEYDHNLLTISKERLEELFLAADYLDVKSLVKVICKVIASKVRNRAPYEICYYFRSWT